MTTEGEFRSYDGSIGGWLQCQGCGEEVSAQRLEGLGYWGVTPAQLREFADHLESHDRPGGDDA